MSLLRHIRARQFYAGVIATFVVSCYAKKGENALERCQVIYNPQAETMPRKGLEQVKLDRLRHIVNYCYENVPFYKRRFDQIGLKPEHIRTLEDIRLIPPTTKADLRDNYPFGLFAVDREKIVRIHASSGTTGKPTVVGYTKNDLEMWSQVMARIICAAGVTSRDISPGLALATACLPAPWGCTTAWSAWAPRWCPLPRETRKSN